VTELDDRAKFRRAVRRAARQVAAEIGDELRVEAICASVRRDLEMARFEERHRLSELDRAMGRRS